MAFSKARRLSDFIAADGSIPTGKFASSTITSAHLVDGTVAHADLHTNMDLTGKTVLVANASTGDNDTTAANTAFVQQEIAALVDSSPSALNTLNELAAALGDDANFSTTVNNNIATKLPLAGGTMSGNLNMGSQDITNLDTLSSTHFSSSANINSSGDGGVFIPNGKRLGFDQTGTRSWTQYAAGGNLLFASGDGNGAIQANNFTGVTYTATGLIKTTGNVEIASAQPLLILDRADGSYAWNIYNGNGSGNFPTSTFNIANNANTPIITALDAGHVGIGTTTPNQWASYTDSSATVLQLKDTSQRARMVINGNFPNLDLVNSAGGADDKHLNLLLTNGYAKFGSLTDNGSAWVQQYILSMDIGNGNVGIGGADRRARLDLNGNGVSAMRWGSWSELGEENSHNSLVIGNNVYVDAAQTKVRATTNDGYRAIRMKYNEGITFHTALGSGSAVANAVVGNERLRIAADGHLTIGTGRLNLSDGMPIVSDTDSGTKLYTHLCTGSFYQGTNQGVAINTNIPSYNVTGNNMFSIYIKGYVYDSTGGGIIDCCIGTYSGEGAYHNNSYTAQNIPKQWQGKIRLAKNISTDKVVILLGDTDTGTNYEIAVDCAVQGFANEVPAYMSGWTMTAFTNTNAYDGITTVKPKETQLIGFEAYSTGFTKNAGWSNISSLMSTEAFDFGGYYNTSNGRFTPQVGGIYQFNVGGYSSYADSNGANRYAFAIAKNGSLNRIAGGNFSAGDSPLVGLSKSVYLDGSSDYVELRMYSSVNGITVGHSSHPMWWEGFLISPSRGDTTWTI